MKIKPRQIVIDVYPKAIVKLRPTGKRYYQVINDGNILGQGKSRMAAWISASRNISE